MSDYEAGKTGAVLDKENDGRLKENRDAGRTIGTTEHSREAPHVRDEDDKDTETSVKEEDEAETEDEAEEADAEEEV